jgi:hypothetical protein
MPTACWTQGKEVSWHNASGRAAPAASFWGSRMCDGLGAWSTLRLAAIDHARMALEFPCGCLPGALGAVWGCSGWAVPGVGLFVVGERFDQGCIHTGTSGI